MNDEEIIQLYFDRKESAIAASEQKYGGLCRSVARRILPDLRDVEECLSDLWIRIWNAIPPERPGSLRAYLARVMRNLALDKARTSAKPRWRNRLRSLSQVSALAVMKCSVYWSRTSCACS